MRQYDELYELVFYQTIDGRCLIKSWLAELDDYKGSILIARRFDRLRLGNFGDVKALGLGLFELRIHYGPGYRIYFSKVSRKEILLLWAGRKQTQRQDIIKAQKLLEEFIHAKT